MGHKITSGFLLELELRMLVSPLLRLFIITPLRRCHHSQEGAGLLEMSAKVCAGSFL